MFEFLVLKDFKHTKYLKKYNYSKFSKTTVYQLVMNKEGVYRSTKNKNEG